MVNHLIICPLLQAVGVIICPLLPAVGDGDIISVNEHRCWRDPQMRLSQSDTKSKGHNLV